MEGRRRIETGALFLPIFGALLIVPPLVGVFNVPIAIFGLPVVAIYLFAVWLGLIVATAVMSRRLDRAERTVGSPPGEDRSE
ncbi:MAG: hypothetical protein KKH72_10290 [Alphaproteobacteria bacterium]|nr:hypothetical protein [Alphaproteobacteria bacterium]